jgi:hypothetical protein
MLHLDQKFNKKHLYAARFAKISDRTARDWKNKNELGISIFSKKIRSDKGKTKLNRGDF